MKTMYDAVILLGGGINPDGSLGLEQKQQVELAAKLWTNKSAANVIACGSYAYKNAWRPPITEARSYADYLETLAVPAANIHLDEVSAETIGSMYFSKKVALQQGWNRVAIIPAIGHSTERVTYIVKKVLGPEYEWEILRPHENLNANNLAREQRSLLSTIKINGMVDDGDHEAVYRLLCETHPSYGGSKSVEELKAFLDHEIAS